MWKKSDFCSLGTRRFPKSSQVQSTWWWRQRDLDQSSAQFLKKRSQTPSLKVATRSWPLMENQERGCTTGLNKNMSNEFNEPEERKAVHVGKHEATCHKQHVGGHRQCSTYRADPTKRGPPQIRTASATKAGFWPIQRWRSAFARSFHPAPHFLIKALSKPRTQLFLGCLQD